MEDNVIESFVANISFDMDVVTVDKIGDIAKEAMKLLRRLGKFGTAAALVFTVLAEVSYKTIKLVFDVAQGEAEYKKLASQMWITEDSAKSLSIALKAMGAKAEDVANVKELRDQFFRLRDEINNLATPKDAPELFRYIRGITYDIQSLQVKLKFLKEWIVYYLIKYLHPFIKDLKKFINDLGDSVSTNISQKSAKIARILFSVISLVISPFELLIKALKSFGSVVTELPKNVKKWALIFSMVGLIFMSSPLGIFLTILGGLALLLEDYKRFKDGHNSSGTLAPMWEKLDRFFTKKDTKQIVDKTNKFLHKCYAGLIKIKDRFLEGFDFLAIKHAWHDAMIAWKEALLEWWKLIKSLFEGWGDSEKQSEKQDIINIPHAIGKVLNDAVVLGGQIVGQVGLAFQALACVLRGDWAGAWRILKKMFPYAMKKGAKNKIHQFFEDYGASQIGLNVSANAQSNYAEGEQWTAQDNMDVRNECASWVSDVYRSSGIEGLDSMNGDVLVSQFGDAYHPVGDGYTPEPGDMINWPYHVGIYLGGGMYRARNASGGVHTGTMEEGNEWFGEPLGYGSIAQYYQNVMGKDPGYTNTVKSISNTIQQGWKKISDTAGEIKNGVTEAIESIPAKMQAIPGSLSNNFMGSSLVSGAGTGTFSMGRVILNEQRNIPVPRYENRVFTRSMKGVFM